VSAAGKGSGPCRACRATRSGITISPVRRTLLAAVAGALLVGLIAVALASGSGEQAAPVSALTAAAAPTTSVAQSVPSASGAVLAEMTRRVGTPRRVARAAHKRARELAGLRARIAAER